MILRLLLTEPDVIRSILDRPTFDLKIFAAIANS
jgi:hypothetical protein